MVNGHCAEFSLGDIKIMDFTQKINVWESNQPKTIMANKCAAISYNLL